MSYDTWKARTPDGGDLDSRECAGCGGRETFEAGLSTLLPHGDVELCPRCAGEICNTSGCLRPWTLVATDGALLCLPCADARRESEAA